MSVETARKAIDFFFNQKISGNQRRIGVTFFGGEPFLELDLIEEVVAYARKPRPNCYKQIRFSATTNGTVASERVRRIIRDANMALLISFDGVRSAERHRPFISGRESGPNVEKNLPKLLSWAKLGVVRMTFHPRALNFVENIRHAMSLGARSIALCAVTEADWTGHEAALEQAYEEFADFFITESRQGRLPQLEVTIRALHDLHRGRQDGSRPRRPCDVGTYLLGIEPGGSVMPCHRFDRRPHDWLGHVDSTELDAKRARYIHLSSADFTVCESCEARTICGGGCRATALNAGLRLNEPEPAYCLLTRAHYKAVTRIYDTLMAERNPGLSRLLALPAQLDGVLTELATR